MAVSVREKIKSFPERPGVYLMKDASGEIIYIGKAKSLKARLNSYFNRDLSAKTIAQMANVSDIKFKLCPNESLALFLEAALIRKYKPKYNVSLRDDKSFPLVKITGEDFPRILVTRKKEADASLYLGPYTSADLLRQALKIIRRSLGFRTCKILPKQPCIYYRLNLCPAPCAGKISRKDYAAIVSKVAIILQGKAEILLNKLYRQMQAEAAKRNFEKAALIRDQANALASLGSAASGVNPSRELEELKELLKLGKLPLRIEAFDISNISGKEACGAMVSFFAGRSDKNNYRRFRIKMIKGIDDYGMLAEVVARRYQRLLREKSALPDLILIDGGRAHLLTAQKELANLDLEIPLVSIAKEEENIYTSKSDAALRFEQDTPALNLIRRIRDEAHRFALSYHHVLRRRRVIGK